MTSIWSRNWSNVRSLQATSYGGLKGKLTPVWPNAHFFEKNIWSALLIFQKQFLI